MMLTRTTPKCPDCGMPAERPDGLCAFCAEARARTARGVCWACDCEADPSPDNGGDGTVCYACRDELAVLTVEARTEREHGA